MALQQCFYDQINCLYNQTISNGIFNSFALQLLSDISQNGGGGGGGGGTSSNFNAAFPTAGTAIGVLDSTGTNMVALKLGQQVANNSVPVVLTAAQIATLTPPASTSINPSATTTAFTPILTTALSNTAVVLKASAGRLYYYHIYNPNLVPIFVQFYNVAAGSVTVGTTVPQRVLSVPAGGVLDTAITLPWSFATAISYAATTTATGGSAPTTPLLANIDII